MPRRVAQFYPQRVNLRVPAMAYTADVTNGDIIHVQYGAPAALATSNIFNALSIAAAGTFVPQSTAYTASEAQMGRYGRGVQLVASGAYTGVVSVIGRDYLGQRMQENITGNGTTPVLGLKAFRYVDSIIVPTLGAVTIDIGTSNRLGLPYKFDQLIAETKNNIAAANAGTFTPGLANTTTPTAGNADVRGTYLPVTIVPDGVNTFELRYIADTSNLHGNRQFLA
ncbi:hypothetical protein UFOVP810_49 [uncultured Caudovirales phage]|uniref:Uncharacterized protein n=1 Tax=uncultured Caudovirales phage TaxID=2100421 RepID=A0A6J5P851_9CAUD|nr:hypothetical protein UFOVP810_49 [uncultured Caudovirales phage]